MKKLRIRRAAEFLKGLQVPGLFAPFYEDYQRDIRRARLRVSFGSQIAHTRCGQIEYAVSGNGPPVMVVHGAGGGFDQGMDFSRDLVASGFRVIAMSRFGYLRTPLPPDASPATQADAHACLLDALNIQRVAMIGASAGAPSAMQFALRHPQRIAALVLLVPMAYVPRAGGAMPKVAMAATGLLLETVMRSDFLIWAMSRFARKTVCRAILATPPEILESASDEEQARIEQVIEHLLPVGPRRLGLLNDGAVLSSLPRYELERIAAPTLVVSAADDLYGTFDGARYSAEHIPHARFIGYPEGGHLWVGHHKDVVFEIGSFLNQAA